MSAVIERWEPPGPDGGGDIAVLRLPEPLPEGRPVTMVEAADVWGHPMRTFGFPIGREFGVWHSGRLLGRQAAGWIQAQLAEPTDYRIEQGFSGAPVWDDELGGVVGMVVAAESSTTPAGYLITAPACAKSGNHVWANGMIEVWVTETGQARAPIAAPGVARLLGFDSAGHLVTEKASDFLEFWDLQTGRQSGLLRLATPIDFRDTVEEGRRLMVSGDFGLPY